MTETAETPTVTVIRAAIRQVLADHAPVGKRYDADGGITKICRCGLETDGATLTARTQHLEDVTTVAVLVALQEHQRDVEEGL